MKYLYIFIAVVALTGCLKDEKYDSLLIFTPTEQVSDSADAVALDGVVTYAFLADTTDYEVINYDNALRGVIYDKLTGEELLPIAVGEAYEGGEEIYQVAMQVAEESVMLVAVDTKNEDYAYANYAIGLNLATTYIALPFRPYKEVDFKVSNWWYVVPEPIIVDEEEVEEQEEEIEEEELDELEEDVDELIEEEEEEFIEE